MPASKANRFRDQVFDHKTRPTVRNIAMMSTGLVPITCDGLRQLLDRMLEKDSSSNVLILDCRPFLTHNEAHIVQSVNIHCPAIIRWAIDQPLTKHLWASLSQSCYQLLSSVLSLVLRRRTGNRMPIKTIIPDQQIRDRLSTDYYYPVVVYEETDLTTDSIGSYVAKCLQMELGIKTVHILQGNKYVSRHS